MRIEPRTVTWVAVFVAGAFTAPAISIVAIHGFTPRRLLTGLGLTVVLFVGFALPMLVVHQTLRLWGRFTESHVGALVNTVLSATVMVVVVTGILSAFRSIIGPPLVIAFVAGDWFVKTVAPWLGLAVVVWIVGAFLAGTCMPFIERITRVGVLKAGPETQREEADD